MKKKGKSKGIMEEIINAESSCTENIDLERQNTSNIAEDSRKSSEIEVPIKANLTKAGKNKSKK